MGDIAYPYAVVDGNTFSSDGFNRDLYSSTAGESPYETANGHIEDANLDAGTFIEAEHVRARQVASPGTAGLTHTIDIYQDAWAQATDYKAVGGCSYTFYQPWDTTICMTLFHVFASAWRLAGVRDTTDPARPLTTGPDIILKPYIDEVACPHLEQKMPESFWFDNVAWDDPTDPADNADSDGTIHIREAFCTRHFSLAHLNWPGGGTGDASQPITKGEHSVSLRVYVKPNLLVNRYAITGGDIRPDAWFESIHRLRLGIRHVDVIPLF